ncbi:hypothetical protein R1sor_014430 [Riccia sorocarpa]|uniref:Malonyl-CoA decarboxylase C-terminal domain-containing protein n=1 Tax=Riccia sorocarpa TaxID=122646 RepID=A0ABD3HDN0_9MARC
MKSFFQQTAEPLPHKESRNENIDGIIYRLPKALSRDDVYMEILGKMEAVGMTAILRVAFDNLWKKEFPNYGMHNSSAFAKCLLCVKFTTMLQRERRSAERAKLELDREKHLKHQMSGRTVYYSHRVLSTSSPSLYLSFIHDAMDLAKTIIPRLCDKVKTLMGSVQPLPLKVIGILNHGHERGVVAHVTVGGLWKSDPNYTITSIAKQLRDYENFHTDKKLGNLHFTDQTSHPLFNALMDEEVFNTTVLAKKRQSKEEFFQMEGAENSELQASTRMLPPNLYIQLDNSAKDNKDGNFHYPVCAGEPVTFCELALSNKLEGSIQNILYDEPPIAEEAATTAIFYAITHTQSGLAGIEIGDSLLKKVIRVLRQDNPRIQTFCTLSPVLGFSQWLLPELESQIIFAQVDSESSRESDGVPASKENLLLPEEQDILVKACSEFSTGGESRSGLQIMRELLTSPSHGWAKSAKVAVALRAPLMRLCARYLILEKKDGRALDFLTNFHVLNGAVSRFPTHQLSASARSTFLGWRIDAFLDQPSSKRGAFKLEGDTSHKALEQSAGMMVNYMYRLENLDTNTQLYLTKGIISVSPAVEQYLLGLAYSEKQKM